MAQERFKISDIKRSVLKLSLVKRRQEVRGSYNGTPIIDDFAHHPRAVEVTLQAIAQRYPGRELNVIFEPHSATARSNVFQKEFQRAFMTAQNIAVTRIKRATSVKNGENLDLEAFASALTKEDIKTQILDNVDEIIDWIENLFSLLHQSQP